MTDDQKLADRMRRWEKIICRSDVRARPRTMQGEEVYEIEIRGGRQPTPAERLERDDFREYWLQRYITENYRRLGFAAIEGPRPRMEAGPDFRVKKSIRGPWYDAEAVVNWKSYTNHGHHLSRHFTNVKYLLLLCVDDPPPEARKNLPPRVLHVDRAHFLEWCKVPGFEYAREARALFQHLAIEYLTQHCVNEDGGEDGNAIDLRKVKLQVLRAVVDSHL